ncbi:hypothetical protein OQA88_3216 [Cercophora sp. LCS_1]
MHYAAVMDVMVQHHPEYVSLAWGVLKLAFIGVTNHETLIKELSKALCRMCEAVRHVELKLLLYPTKEMQGQVEALYVHLVKFGIRAIKWYREPRLLHAVTSITRPYALRFKDLVDDIHDTIRQIDRLALSMSQAELRRILLKLDDNRSANEAEQRQIRLELEATRKELQATRAVNAETSRLMVVELKKAIDAQLQFTGLINTNRQLAEVQFSQIMTFLSASNLPPPDAVRNTLSAKRKLRLRRSSDHPSLYGSPLLQEWGALTSSSQILVDGSFSSRRTLRDFAVDVIDLVSSVDIPAVWALESNPCSEEEFVTSDILKYLASQILQLNRSMADERSVSLSARRFQSARTEAEWFALLGTVMEGLEQVYLVVDLELVDRLGEGQSSWLRNFPLFFEQLRMRGVKTVVKVVFVKVTGVVEEEEVPNRTAHIRIRRRDSGRVKKAGAKRGKGSKKRWVKALQPMLGGCGSPAARIDEA